ncbi:NUDIX domain-containing protein [Candidatus Saccharibacteria bacterium]|nr:NUDIX domain-containing protein [Candidatus Saccharibacteria bacterium]
MAETALEFPEEATREERTIDWKLLAEISDKDFRFTDLVEKSDKTRFSVRILLCNNRSEICVIKSEKYGYLQLPGGGIEKGEGIIEAAIRETKEESGYLMKNIEALGYTIEHRESVRNHHNWRRDISFTFMAAATKNVGTNYMEDEITEGFIPVWMGLDEVILELEQNEGSIENYSGCFSNRRDLSIVKFFRRTSIN